MGTSPQKLYESCDLGAIAGDALMWCSAPAKLQISTPYEYMIEHVLVVFVWRCTVADWLVYSVQYREISAAVSDAWDRKMEGRTEWYGGHLNR